VCNTKELKRQDCIEEAERQEGIRRRDFGKAGKGIYNNKYIALFYTALKREKDGV